MTLIKDQRKAVQAQINSIEEMRNNIPAYKACGREMSLVITKLQEAKMWLGQCLGSMGSELPAEYRDNPADNVVSGTITGTDPAIEESPLQSRKLEVKTEDTGSELEPTVGEVQVNEQPDALPATDNMSPARVDNPQG